MDSNALVRFEGDDMELTEVGREALGARSAAGPPSSVLLLLAIMHLIRRPAPVGELLRLHDECLAHYGSPGAALAGIDSGEYRGRRRGRAPRTPISWHRPRRQLPDPRYRA